MHGLNKKENKFRKDVIFGCADGLRSSNRSRILKFENNLEPDLDHDSKVLEQ